MTEETEKTPLAGRDREAEADRNFETFKSLLPDLLKEHGGKYALMRQGKLVQVLDTARDAMVVGHAQFEDGLFSVQEITDRAVDLGFYSHAMRHVQV